MLTDQVLEPPAADRCIQDGWRSQSVFGVPLVMLAPLKDGKDTLYSTREYVLRRHSMGLKQPNDAFVRPGHTFPVVEMLEYIGRSFQPDPCPPATRVDRENC